MVAGAATPPVTTDDPATTLITHYYQSILERPPEPTGLAFWQGLVAEKQAQGADIKEVFREMADYFFNSDEYLARHTTDRQFINNLYGTFFQRVPDEGGYTFWLDKLANGMTRNEAMSGFLYSQEFTDFMQGILEPGGELIVLINADATDNSNVQPYLTITVEGGIHAPYLNRDGAGLPTSVYGMKYISADGETLYSIFDPATGLLTILYFTDATGKIRVDVKSYDATTGKGDLTITYEDGTIQNVTSASLDFLPMPLIIEVVSPGTPKLDDYVYWLRDWAGKHAAAAANWVSKIGSASDPFKQRTNRLVTRISNDAPLISKGLIQKTTYENQQSMDDAVQGIPQVPAAAKQTYSTRITTEYCGDRVDNNGDGQIDEDCSFDNIDIYLWDNECPDDVANLNIDGVDYGNTPEGKGRYYQVSKSKLGAGEHIFKVTARMQ